MSGQLLGAAKTRAWVHYLTTHAPLSWGRLVPPVRRFAAVLPTLVALSDVVALVALAEPE